MDDTRAVLERYKDFDVGFIQQDRGVKVSLTGAPADAFVDGKMIRGIRELLFAVLRDIVFTRNEIIGDPRFDLATAGGTTNAVATAEMPTPTRRVTRDRTIRGRNASSRKTGTRSRRKGSMAW